MKRRRIHASISYNNNIIIIIIIYNNIKISLCLQIFRDLGCVNGNKYIAEKEKEAQQTTWNLNALLCYSTKLPYECQTIKFTTITRQQHLIQQKLFHLT